jgi:hypothetical protein
VSDRIAAARLLPRDLELLERRARALAAGDDGTRDGEAEADGRIRLVLFRILGLPCAVEAAPVERAVSRLLGATAVPMAEGRDRTVAFVDEQPLPVADLAGAVAGVEREASELAGASALVVATALGSVAVAVEGPLDLREERIAAAARAATEETGLRLAGRLADGTSVLDASWLVAWAGKAARA